MSPVAGVRAWPREATIGPEMLPGMPLLTPRLRIRPLQGADADAMFEVYSDPEGMRYVGDGSPIERPDVAAWIQKTERNYEARGYGMFAIEEAEGGVLVGFIGLVHPGDQPEPELKYAFLPSRWGRGYATEAARAVVAFGRASLGLGRIIATTDPEHTASHRVLEKAGFTRGAPRFDEQGEIAVFESEPA